MIAKVKTSRLLALSLLLFAAASGCVLSNESPAENSSSEFEIDSAADGSVVYEKPSAANTGPVGPLAAYAGPSRITVSGTVVENVSIAGTIYIEADDVTFRNFRLDASGYAYGFTIESGRSGALIESGEIVNMNSCAILGTGFTARRLNIHDSGADGIKPQGLDGFPVLVEACYIHNLGTLADAHADGCQTQNGRDITFRYNTIYMPDETSVNYPGAPYKASGVFELQYSITNFVIEHNWLNGAGYTIRRDKYDGLPSGVSVRRNKFGRDFASQVSSGTFDEWIGNTWEDTGLSVSELD